MNRFNYRSLLIIFISSIILTFGSVSGQEKEEEKAAEKEKTTSVTSFNFGADLVSRYVWRGNELGAVDGNNVAAPHIQPYGSLDFNLGISGSLSLGLWGSYAFSGKYSENDFSLKYSIPLSFGSVSATITDYYFPFVDSLKFSDFSGDGQGAHTVEAALSITGPETFPVSLLVSKNIHNDPADNKSLYFEAGYSFSINETPVSLFIGAAQGFSLWHNVLTDKMELTNIGFNVTKEIKLTNDFSLPAGLSFVYNPHIKNSFLVFKLSL